MSSCDESKALRLIGGPADGQLFDLRSDPCIFIAILDDNMTHLYDPTDGHFVASVDIHFDPQNRRNPYE